VDAFDADVLIYAAVSGHLLGRRIPALFPSEPVDTTRIVAGIESVLLLPELLSKPQGRFVRASAAALLAGTAAQIGCSSSLFAASRSTGNTHRSARALT
jgi:hypothetical protein